MSIRSIDRAIGILELFRDIYKQVVPLLKKPSNNVNKICGLGIWDDNSIPINQKPEFNIKKEYISYMMSISIPIRGISDKINSDIFFRSDSDDYNEKR
jgi:hypothetical protein